LRQAVLAIAAMNDCFRVRYRPQDSAIWSWIARRA
jgi:hypothetical protein